MRTQPLNKRIRTLGAIGLLAGLVGLALAGCAGGPRVKMAPGYEKTPTRVDAQANVLGTPDATAVPPTPTPQPLALDDAPYTLPSQALSIAVPLGWKLASEADNYAHFEAPDQMAWLEAAVESSGYELPQADLEQYLAAMMDALYRGVDSYQLLDQQITEGQAEYTSSYQKNGFTWFTRDVFVQRGAAIYALSFQGLARVWDAYLPGFQAVSDSLETRTGYIDEDMIYRFMSNYVSPNVQFSLSVPMGWTLTRGAEGPQGATLDEVLSPDGQAAVEVLVYEAGQDLLNTDIGQVSIPLMKALDGEDLRIRANDVLLDGRIRVDWQIDNQDVYAFTFFWQKDTTVYILTFKYADEHSAAYQETLRRVGDSFAFVDAAN
ncbi:MAG: hypothetical protein PWQ55_596 [Chloroflexota bacterium]|nr:hypothetical protein [Chloroflexota bacterium]